MQICKLIQTHQLQSSRYQKTLYPIRILKHRSFLHKSHNICTDKNYKIINKLYLIISKFSMSQKFPVIQSLSPCGQFCLCTLMIAINVTVAIYQLLIRQFSSFGKRLICCILYERKVWRLFL